MDTMVLMTAFPEAWWKRCTDRYAETNERREPEAFENRQFFHR